MKNKIKKIFVAFQLFFIGTISKVFALSIFDVQRGYDVQPEYGIELEPSPLQKSLSIVLPLILFVIGLFVVFSKKITKKVKVIVISSLIAVGILGWIIFMNI